MFAKPSVKNRVSTKSRVLALSIVLAWVCGQYSTYVDYPAMLVASVALSRAGRAQTLAMTSTHNSIETKSINLKSDGLRSEKCHTGVISFSRAVACFTYFKSQFDFAYCSCFRLCLRSLCSIRIVTWLGLVTCSYCTSKQIAISVSLCLRQSIRLTGEKLCGRSRALLLLVLFLYCCFKLRA